MENNIFWSAKGSGFGELGSTPHQEFPGVPPGPFRFIHRLESSPQQGRARFSRHFFATLSLCTVQLTGDFKPLTQCFMYLKAGNQTQGATHTRTFKRNWHVCAVLGIHSLSIEIRSIQVLFLLFSNTRLKPLENICQERGRKPTRLKAYLRPSISARSLKNPQRTCDTSWKTGWNPPSARAGPGNDGSTLPGRGEGGGWGVYWPIFGYRSYRWAKYQYPSWGFGTLSLIRTKKSLNTYPFLGNTLNFVTLFRT